MSLARSDDNGWYSWNEFFTEVSAAKSPRPLSVQGTERKQSALEAISVLKGLIEACQASHPECAMQRESLPTQVIDVAGNQISLHIPNGERESYAALSHCWGKLLLIQTHRSTMGDRIVDIPWASLSKNIQGAVTTTILLGLKYLWIDSLCIIQDDPEAWARESGSMASLRGSSAVMASKKISTIDHPRSPPSLCSKVSMQTVTCSRSRSVRETITDGTEICYHLGAKLFETPPLFTRGWAFQEMLLATRLCPVPLPGAGLGLQNFTMVRVWYA